MNSAEQLLGRSLLIILLFAPALQAIAAPTDAAKCANVQILTDQLTARKAEAYCVYAVAERQKVEDFWGATWKEPIRIHVDGSYRISKALILAYHGNRGFMEMPLRGVRNNNGALYTRSFTSTRPMTTAFLQKVSRSIFIKGWLAIGRSRILVSPSMSKRADDLLTSSLSNTSMSCGHLGR